MPVAHCLSLQSHKIFCNGVHALQTKVLLNISVSGNINSENQYTSFHNPRHLMTETTGYAGVSNKGIAEYAAIGNGKCDCYQWYASGRLACGYVKRSRHTGARLHGHQK